MKRPIHGEELTIHYKGALVKASCRDVVDFSARGPGAVKFNIVSKTIFQRGSDATLLDHGAELPIKVERVTSMGHKPVSIVSLSGIFEPQP